MLHKCLWCWIFEMEWILIFSRSNTGTLNSIFSSIYIFNIFHNALALYRFSSAFLNSYIIYHWIFLRSITGTLIFYIYKYWRIFYTYYIFLNSTIQIKCILKLIYYYCDVPCLRRQRRWWPWLIIKAWE